MSEITDEEWALLNEGFTGRGAGGITYFDPKTSQRIPDPNRPTIPARPATGATPVVTDQDAMVSIETAKRIMVESAPAAAAMIANLAQNGHNERVQLDASKYIMERVLGPAGQKIEAAKGPLE